MSPPSAWPTLPPLPVTLQLASVVFIKIGKLVRLTPPETLELETVISFRYPQPAAYQAGPEGVGEGVGLNVGVGLGEAVGVSVAVGVGDTVSVGVDVGVGAEVGVG